MITYTYTEDPPDGPKDIDVVTDDADAELAKIEDAFGDAFGNHDYPIAESPTYANFRVKANESDQQGNFRFTITGAEAREIAVIFDLAGIEPSLGDWLDARDGEAIEEMEEAGGDAPA